MSSRGGKPRWWQPVITRKDVIGCLTFGPVGAAVAAMQYPASRYWVLIAVLWAAGFLLAEHLFTTGTTPIRYQRPVGQMIIATFLNLLLALALGVAAFVLGIQGWLKVSVSYVGALVTASALVAIQGLAVTLYVWWRWFGDRHFDKMLDGIVERMRQETAPEKNAPAGTQDAHQPEENEIRAQQDEIRLLSELRRRQRAGESDPNKPDGDQGGS